MAKLLRVAELEQITRLLRGAASDARAGPLPAWGGRDPLLVGFAWLGGDAVRRRLLPAVRGRAGAPGELVIALALLIWAAEVLGTFGLSSRCRICVLVAAIGWAWEFRAAARRGGVAAAPRPSN